MNEKGNQNSVTSMEKGRVNCVLFVLYFVFRMNLSLNVKLEVVLMFAPAF